MKIFLAGIESSGKLIKTEKPSLVLFSFASVNNFCVEYIRSKECKDYLLDSGAFTFMNSNKTTNWQAYIDSYIDFINKNDIKHFFELDIDSIVGYEKVKQIRKYIEQKTGKKCIPVWHKSRGKEEFIKMCGEYDYVAIGGIVTKEIKKTEYKFFKWFITEAHKRGCKIHGLGFTPTKSLSEYKFDSVDSTNWLSGARFGSLYYFNGRYIQSKNFENKRAKKEISVHNLREWIKFQKYADKNL